MTSNIGSQHPTNGYSGLRNSKEVVMEDVKEHFRPEMINRIDEVVVFHRFWIRLISAALRKIQQKVWKNVWKRNTCT